MEHLFLTGFQKFFRPACLPETLRVTMRAGNDAALRAGNHVAKSLRRGSSKNFWNPVDIE